MTFNAFSVVQFNLKTNLEEKIGLDSGRYESFGRVGRAILRGVEGSGRRPGTDLLEGGG